MPYYRMPLFSRLCNALLVLAILAVPVGAIVGVMQLAKTRDQVTELRTQLERQTSELEALAAVTADALEEAVEARAEAALDRANAERAAEAHRQARGRVTIVAPDSVRIDSQPPVEIPPAVVQLIQDADATIAAQTAAIATAHAAIAAGLEAEAALAAERDKARAALATATAGWELERKRGRWRTVRDVALGLGAGAIAALIFAP